MAWYYDTFECGHEGRVNIIGPVKDRQRKADWEFGSACPDCKEEGRKEAREVAEKQAKELEKEMELPPLEGSEKQIAWANTLRTEWAEKMSNATEKDMKTLALAHSSFVDMSLQDFFKVIDFILHNRTKAHYFIDNRNSNLSMIESEIKNALKTEVELIEEQTLEELKRESTLFPENKVTNAVVEIEVSVNQVAARFEKNEDFRLLVKYLGFKWDSDKWIKLINEYTGSGQERAAELGNKLLNAGFPIFMVDDDTKRAAINGDFEPECNRWIKRVAGTEILAIMWDGFSDDLYEKSRLLPGAKWQNGSMRINVSHYKEVEDFADAFGFKFSAAAKQLIEDYEKSLQSAIVVDPVKVEVRKETNKLEQILESSDDILDDLKD